MMVPQLKEKLAFLSDAALLEMAESKSGEYTSDAFNLINNEVVRRGGLESLKTRALHAEKPQPNPGELTRVKRLFAVTVIAACGLFIFAVNGSSWFYWICLFALMGTWFAVLFRPRHNPEEEIKELLSKAHGDAESTGEPPVAEEPGPN